MTAAVKETPIQRLARLGQSVWLDYIHRHMTRSGELRRMIEHDGLRGVTSNPAIFEKAISTSLDYDDDIARYVAGALGAQEICEKLSVRDVQEACDAFTPLYEQLDGRDGFVSLEVSPHLARDLRGTVEEARRLWHSVGRPNLLVKIPGTAECLPAVRECIYEGINVNVTLLFGLGRYQQVAAAFVEGLQRRAHEGKGLRVASVASFFLSRIDSLLDPMLQKIADAGGSLSELAGSMVGHVAICSAQAAYLTYKEVFKSPIFAALEARGARPQRLLWASTSTKNPAYADTKYVEPLIGHETINTLPMETFQAFADHGRAEATLERDAQRALDLLSHLSDLGIRLDDATAQLEREGVEKFVQPYDRLMAALRAKGAK